MGLGGNPYGPAGTGKTESVKALGGLFGRQVLVFNCDEVSGNFPPKRTNVCMCIRTYIHMHTYVHACIHAYVHRYSCMYLTAHVCTYVSIHKHMYVCACVCKAYFIYRFPYFMYVEYVHMSFHTLLLIF